MQTAVKTAASRRRHLGFLGAAVLGLLLRAGLAQAAEEPYDQAKFEAAVAAGKPVVLNVQAGWCPTCKQQRPIVQALEQQANLKDVTVFTADFDKEATMKRRLKVPMQGTFIVFKGGKEVARSTGVTDKAAIAELFAMAL